MKKSLSWLIESHEYLHALHPALITVLANLNLSLRDQGELLVEIKSPREVYFRPVMRIGGRLKWSNNAVFQEHFRALLNTTQSTYPYTLQVKAFAHMDAQGVGSVQFVYDPKHNTRKKEIAIQLDTHTQQMLANYALTDGVLIQATVKAPTERSGTFATALLPKVHTTTDNTSLLLYYKHRVFFGKPLPELPKSLEAKLQSGKPLTVQARIAGHSWEGYFINHVQEIPKIAVTELENTRIETAMTIKEVTVFKGFNRVGDAMFDAVAPAKYKVLSAVRPGTAAHTQLTSLKPGTPVTISGSITGANTRQACYKIKNLRLSCKM